MNTPLAAIQTESQYAFANRMDVNRSTVTRWKNAGRLVLIGKKVDVSASMDLIEQTKAGNDGVAQRHKMEREERRILAGKERKNGKVVPEQAKADEADQHADQIRDEIRDASLRKALADARIKCAHADMKEQDRDQKARTLVPREEVNYVLDDFGAMLRTMLDGRAERLGAELGLTHDQVEGVSESDEWLLLELSDKLKAQAKK